MGNTNTVPETKTCSACNQVFHVHIVNPCSKIVCLKCYWSHYKQCFRCQQNENSAKEETNALLELLRKELAQLKLEKTIVQEDCNSATKRYQREVINSHEKERDLRKTQQENEEQKKQIQTLQQKVNCLVRQTVSLNTELNQARFNALGEKSSLQNQLSREKLRGDQLESKLRQAEAKLTELNPDKSPLAAQLRKKTKQCIQLNQEVAEQRKLMKEKDALIARQNDALQESSGLQLRSGHLEIDNQQLKAKVEQLQADRTFQPSKHHLSTWKRYFIEMSVDNLSMGRVIIETYPECAPNVCQLFHKFMNGIEAIYLLNQITNVKSGSFIVIPEATTRSGDPLPLFAADFNDLEVKRGAVGMRVKMLKPNDVHMIGSGFSIALDSVKDPLFSHVFGYVIDGLTICDAISRLDPTEHRIIVSDCGDVKI